MNDLHFLQKLYKNYISKTYSDKLRNSEIIQKLHLLPVNKKQELSQKFISQGEDLLLKNLNSAIKYFDSAEKLDPTNPSVWYRIGLSYFEIGSSNDLEKYLKTASKKFKVAMNLDPTIFSFWWSLALTLSKLGSLKNDIQYLLDAKKKFEKTLLLAISEKNEVLADLYWDFGRSLTILSNLSGEAIDVRQSINAFRKSLTYQKEVNHFFWHDFGSSYLQMGLLINDNSTYLQAIDYFKKTLRLENSFFEGWTDMASAYTQLYINTLNEKYFNSANDCYIKASKINNTSSDLYLEWSELICEAGINKKDISKLKQSLTHAIYAKNLGDSTPAITAQIVESQAMLGAFSNRLELIIEAENKIIEAADEFSKNFEIWYAYGICMKAFGIYYNDSDYYEFAIEKFQMGLLHNKTNAELWYELGQTYSLIGSNLEDLDLLNKALSFLKRANNFKPSCPTIIYEYGKTFLRIGEIAESSECIKEALTLFETLLRNQQDTLIQHPTWLFHYGKALDLFGDANEEENYYFKAIDTFHSVLLIDPEYPDIYFQLGKTYSHLGELTLDSAIFQKALSYFMLSIKQDDENDKTYLEWALALIYLAQVKDNEIEANQLYLEAKEKLIRAGSLGNQDALYHMACLYSLTKNYEEAVHFLEKANIQGVLPEIEDLLEDEWLEDFRLSSLFSGFIHNLEKTKKFSDELKDF